MQVSILQLEKRMAIQVLKTSKILLITAFALCLSLMTISSTTMAAENCEQPEQLSLMREFSLIPLFGGVPDMSDTELLNLFHQLVDQTVKTSKSQLSECEILAVKAYTGAASRPMNDKQTNPLLAASLDSALSKIPGFHGQVISFQRYSNQILAGFKSHSKIIIPVYLSATTLSFKDAAYRDRPVVLVINSTNGHLIQDLSEHKWEQEVLFKQGSQFYVESISYPRRMYDKTIIHLREI